MGPSRQISLGSVVRMAAAAFQRTTSRRMSTLKRYALDGVSRGGGVELRTSTGHALRTDMPVSMGGDDEAAQPVEMLLAALVGCETATAHFVARQLWRRRQCQLTSIVWEQ